MVAEKIANVRHMLSDLAGNVPEDTWMFIKSIQAELDCAAHMADRLESLAQVPLAQSAKVTHMHPKTPRNPA